MSIAKINTILGVLRGMRPEVKRSADPVDGFHLFLCFAFQHEAVEGGMDINTAVSLSHEVFMPYLDGYGTFVGHLMRTNPDLYEVMCEIVRSGQHPFVFQKARLEWLDMLIKQYEGRLA